MVKQQECYEGMWLESTAAPATVSMDKGCEATRS